jgi:RES domain-containing protein
MPPSKGVPSRRARPTFTTCACVAYRATSYDVPLWVSPNRRSGRWNIAGETPTQYLALDAEAPFAEIVRHEDLRTEEAASHYSSTIWQMQIEEAMIVDYSSFALAEQAGFDPAALVDDDFERCQVEANRLSDEGARGLLSPSAALPGSINLTLFGPRVGVGWRTTAKLASAIPVQRVATGHPPPSLTSRVRYFGRPHQLLRSFGETSKAHNRPGPAD